jgi:hypothetical protein
VTEQARQRQLAYAVAAALSEQANAERYQHSQRQLGRERAAMDRARLLEFDGNGFPVAQRNPGFVTRVGRLLSP